MLKSANDYSSNPLNYVISILSGKWKPYILWYLSESEGSLRYSELKRRIPYSISHKVFSQQLKELCVEGMVLRKSLPMEENGNMLHVEYSLTDKGRSLSSIMFLMRDWGSVYGDFDNNHQLLDSRGVVGEDKIYYPTHMLRSGSDFKRSDLGDVIVWIRDNKAAIASA